VPQERDKNIYKKLYAEQGLTASKQVTFIDAETSSA
jgi:hypothetical protein